MGNPRNPSIAPHQSRVTPPWVPQDEEQEDHDADDFDDDASEEFEPDYDILAPGDPLDQPPYNRPFRPGDAALANPPGKRPDRFEEEREVPGPDNPAGEPADPGAQADTPEDPVPEAKPRKEITPPPPDVAVVNPDPEAAGDPEEEVPPDVTNETALPRSGAGPEEGLRPEPPEVPPDAEDHPELEEAAPADEQAARHIPQPPAQKAEEPQAEPEPAPAPAAQTRTQQQEAEPSGPAEPQRPAFNMPEISGRTPEEKLNHLAEWAVGDLSARQVFIIDGDGNTVVARNATRGVLLAASQMFAAWVHLGQAGQSAAGSVLQAQLSADQSLVILRGGGRRAEGSLGLTLLLPEDLPETTLQALRGVFGEICEEILEG